MAYESIASHRTMALDRVRNDAYARALRQVVTPDSVVLDLGAGTGVLGMLAARLGARRVYLVEPTDIIAVAQELVGANGLQDRVECVHGRIEDVQLPEKADVIVSVMTGNFLVTEDLLPVLFHARDTALTPGGRLLPDAAAMEATLVSAPDIHEFNVAAWARHEGIDTSAARPYAANTIYYSPPTIRDVAFLAEPDALHQVDLTRDDYVRVHAEVTFDVTQSGTCHGVAGWFRMRLGREWLSTSPREPKVHWSAAFLPIDPPLDLEEGECVTFALDRPPRGDWTWRVSARTGSRRHSTLFGMPLTEKTLRKAGTDYVPAPTADARVVMHVLAAMDGQHDVTAIARSLHGAFPDRYRTEAEALAFTQELVARYA
jgi:SAM-dependent methyltransferase